jgi:5'-3' exonuclease
MLAEKTESEDRVLLVSQDHDYAQMITKKIHWWNPKHNMIYKDGLNYSFEVYHSLVGDCGDHVKGISRFRKTRAMQLAEQYKTVQELLNEESEFEEHSELLMKNAKLLNVYFVQGLSFSENDQDHRKVYRFCKHYELNQIWNRYKTLNGLD